MSWRVNLCRLQSIGESRLFYIPLKLKGPGRHRQVCSAESAIVSLGSSTGTII